MLKLGLISDESGHSHPRALFEYGLSKGIQRFELRQIFGKRVPNLTKEQKDELKRWIQAMDVTISAVSPGLFKCSLYDDAMQYHRNTLLHDALDFAAELQVPKLITFGVQRSAKDKPQDREEVYQLLGEAALAAQKSGVTLCLENEPGWWADSPENLLDLLQTLQNSGLRLNWDPGNLYASGIEDCLGAYRLLRGYITHVHAKDAAKDEDGDVYYAPLGQGSIGWQEQLQLLQEDGYQGDISVETHCFPLPENTNHNIAFLQRFAY